MPEKGYNFENSEKRLKVAKGTKGTRGYNFSLYPVQAAFYKGFNILVHFRYRYNGAECGEGTKGTNPFRGCTLVPFSTAAGFSSLFLDGLGWLVLRWKLA
jgi:hypothetical protein